MSMTDPQVEHIQSMITQALDDYCWEIKKQLIEAQKANASYDDKAYLQGQILGLTQAMRIVRTGSPDTLSE